ncbi:hypothetical protein [Micromonospora fluostatini]|uniref:hypothetical protein n=1 Tax=Micromonospora sp. JCM 30529 TaxID=3421643 RepID=UPI003D186E67
MTSSPTVPATAPAPPSRHRRVLTMLHRWPTGLALLMTVDNWFAPAVLPPWTLLVLPAGYLLIGTVRRRWRTPGALRVELIGLAGYTALAGAAVLVGGDTGAWLVALGWLGHGVWDLVHHRVGRVVPRGYAEWCGVLDLVLGLTMILAIVTG